MGNKKRFGAATAVCTLLMVAGCGGSGDDGPQFTAAQACANLEGETIAAATVVDASEVAATATAPAYCKVNALIEPQLNFELRLPNGWNGKLHYGGGGGYNGSVPPLAGANLNALRKGYATVSSDSGHQASGVDASWALNDPYAAQLFGSLSIPTVMSSALDMVRTAYGAAPVRSYFEGCSNGGREALMTAQRYPNLFDGIIARAPAYNWVGFMGAFNRTAKAAAAPGGAFSAAKVSTLAAAVRDACDADDGIVDGVVANPEACTFDPTVLRCAGGADTGDACLSDAQLAVVTSWTTPAVFAGSPTYRNPGWFLTGNEDDPGAWAAWVTGNGNVRTAAQFLFQDTTVKTYLARDLAADSLLYTPYDQNPGAMYTLASLNDATSTNLAPFDNSGGKLILWHGGNDAALSHKTTSAYYNDVVTTMGGQAAADTFVRYYIAPGVNHCSGGAGADDADLLAALDAWVDGNTAPGTLTANKIVDGETTFSRPLCSYPAYPRYTGPAGDAEAATRASSYTCTE
jgi:pimeloyl-ACP methyl ester carboxylesterase